MNRILTVATFLFVSISCLCQTQSAFRYLEASYMKVKSAEYLALEQETWKPVHQKLVEDGKKTGWFLYKVKYPTGTETRYDYVTLSTYSSWEQLENPWADAKAAFAKVHPDKPIDQVLEQGDTSRDMVWRQLYSLVDVADANAIFSKYLVMNEVQSASGESGLYENLEKTYFKPFHQERISRGIMGFWGLFRRNMPYGEQFPTDYVTINGYDTWLDITRQNPQDVWQKVHGDTDFNKVHDDILSRRTTVNNEMWELVDFVVGR